MLAPESTSTNQLSELVASAIDGDERAFNTLFETYKAYAWGVALRTTSDRTLAEEAVVDGFASAFRSLDRIEDPERFQAYLGSCVRNEIYGQVRKLSRTKYGEFPDDLEDHESAFVAADVSSPESVLISTDDGAQAFAALQRLDDRQKQAIYLVEVEELSTDRAAQVLGLSTNALYQLLFRARRALRLQFIAPALDASAPIACRQCNDGLAAFVRGAARPEARGRIESHLSDCPSCQIRLEGVAETNQLISRAGAVVPAGLGAAVAAKVGFTLTSASSTTKLTRGAALKHIIVAHPVKSIIILVGSVALVGTGIGVASVSSSPASESLPSPNSISHKIIKAAPSKLSPPSTTAATFAPRVVLRVKSGSPDRIKTADVPVTTAPAPTVSTTVAPIIYPAPTFSSTMSPNGASGYSATTPLGSRFDETVSATSTGPPPTIRLTDYLPPGITFSDQGGAVGSFTGVPTASGIYESTVVASTSGGSTAAVITLTVTAPPAFTSSSTLSATVGTSVAFPITASGFPDPAFTVSGTLPPGLQLVSGTNGTISINGTPSAAGTWTLAVRASNSVGSASQTITISVG